MRSDRAPALPLRDGTDIVPPVKLLGHRSNLPLLFRRPRLFAWAYARHLIYAMVGALFDAVTTYVALSHFGADRERHLLIWWAAVHLGVAVGVPLAMAVKLIAALFTAAIWRRWTMLILDLFALFSLIGAIANLMFIRSH